MKKERIASAEGHCLKAELLKMQVADLAHGLGTEEDGKVKISHNIRIPFSFFLFEDNKHFDTSQQCFQVFFSQMKMPRTQ